MNKSEYEAAISAQSQFSLGLIVLGVMLAVGSFYSLPGTTSFILFFWLGNAAFNYIFCRMATYGIPWLGILLTFVWLAKEYLQVEDFTNVCMLVGLCGSLAGVTSGLTLRLKSKQNANE